MTRLIWVILFAVAVGLLTVFGLRLIRTGAGPTALVLDLGAVRREMKGQFPRADFEIRVVTPAKGRRNLVLRIEPGREPATPDRMLGYAEAAVREEVNTTGFDSLFLFISDSLARSLPLC